MNTESITDTSPRSPTRTGALVGAAVGLLLFLPLLTIPEVASLSQFQENMYRLLSILSFPYAAMLGSLAMDLYGGETPMPGMSLLVGAVGVAQFALYGWIIGRISPRGLGVAAVGILHLLGILILS